MTVQKEKKTTVNNGCRVLIEKKEGYF